MYYDNVIKDNNIRVARRCDLRNKNVLMFTFNSYINVAILPSNGEKHLNEMNLIRLTQKTCNKAL